MQLTLTKLKLQKKLSAFFFDVGADRPETSRKELRH